MGICFSISYSLGLYNNTHQIEKKLKLCSVLSSNKYYYYTEMPNFERKKNINIM